LAIGEEVARSRGKKPDTDGRPADATYEERDELPMEEGGDRSLWLIALVAVVIAGITLSVLNRARTKPRSPQELVAVTLRQVMAVQEWQQGQGPRPLIYHPAAVTSNWQPFWLCPKDGPIGQPAYDQAGYSYCPLCGLRMVGNNR